jgi:hypothetical protein
MLKLPRLKKCNKCKENKELECFAKSGSAKGGLQYKCRECGSKTKTSVRIERTLYFYAKNDYKCLDCGMTSKKVGFFDYHHRDPSKKLFNVSSKICLSIDNVSREIKKCDMLCPNCHRIRHIEMRLSDNKEK